MTTDPMLFAQVDFWTTDPLPIVAARLSRAMFEGLPFLELEDGLADDIPAMRLATDFLGLRVILAGREGERPEFTLIVDTVANAGTGLATRTPDPECDISEFLRDQLRKLEGIMVPAPPTRRG